MNYEGGIETSKSCEDAHLCRLPIAPHLAFDGTILQAWQVEISQPKPLGPVARQKRHPIR